MHPLSESEFMAELRSNQGIIYKLVSLYAHDAEEKKDLYQEILLQAWKGWPQFRREAKFSTWLYRICLNTIFTQQRKQHRIDYLESMEEKAPAIESEALQREDVHRLQAAIRRLPETDRAIISLHLDGFDHLAIADMMGITPNNTAVKMYRIKQQLAKLLSSST